MDIGSKLKSARATCGLTQEKVAEEIGVSRQSVSNWENGRSYPDIISVIKLSDLYSVSLDELLKEDKKMINHLDDATNEVKSRRSFSKLIQIGSFLMIWAISVIAFRCGIGSGSDAMGYSILVLYIIMPICILVISFLIGIDSGWGKPRWLMTLFFGAALMATGAVTFGISWLTNLEIITFSDFISMFDVIFLIVGVVVSAIGMGIGTLIRTLKQKRAA